MSLSCSFCGKSQTEVRKLIAGPAVLICDECISLCCDILGENKERVIWDPENPDEVDQARRRFEDLADQGYQPYRLVEVPGEPMKDFQPEAGQLIMIRG